MDKERIIAVVNANQGKSSIELGEMLGMDPMYLRVVCARLRKAGFKVANFQAKRGASPKTKNKYTEVMQAIFEDGIVEYKRLAKRFGWNYRQVGNIIWAIRGNGVDLPRANKELTTNQLHSLADRIEGNDL